MTRKIPLPQLISLRTAAAKLKVSSQFIRDQWALRDWPVYLMGKVFRVRLEDVQEFCRESEWTAAEDDAVMRGVIRRTLQAVEKTRV